MEIWGSLGPLTGALQKLGTPWGPWGKHQKELTAVFTPCEAHLRRLYKNLGLYRLTPKVPYFRKAPVLRLYPAHNG